MISTRSLYRNIDSSVIIQFPEDQKSVESFFYETKLLENFSESQIKFVAKALSGKSEDLMAITAVLDRSMQRQVRIDSTNYRLFPNQKEQALWAINSMKKGAVDISSQTGCSTVFLLDLIH